MNNKPNTNTVSVKVERAVLERCGFDNRDELALYPHTDSLVLLKDKMTAVQLIHAIDHLDSLSAELLSALANACDEDEHEPSNDCSRCRMPCHGIEIPPCLLEEAGIAPNVGLQFDTRNGEIIVSAIDDDWGDDDFDITDYVPERLLELLQNADVCTDNLRELLKNGEIVYAG